MIAIIDYGAANLRSVANAVRRLDFECVISSDVNEIDKADKIILPGVGAAADTMANLVKLGLSDFIRKVIAEARPFLGICIGLQVLMGSTEEGGQHACLHIVPGKVRRLPAGLKVPHMGWNQVRQKTGHPVFAGIPDKANFYFVHSYYAEPEDPSLVAGETEYGIPFCSVLARGNLVATQFHPEKSGELGLRFYHNFLSMKA